MDDRWILAGILAPLMFGFLRLALAHMVMLAHLWPDSIPWAGTYAVFGFYALSGYLMTLVLNARYGFSRRGVARYLTNRALRIYPPYFAAVGLAIAVIALGPESARELNRVLELPASPGSWTRNLLIFGIWGHPARLVPPAWSLEVELVFYILMGLGLSRNRWLTLFWCGASALWTAVMVGQHAPMLLRYGTIPAASLPFSAGALIYHFAPRRPAGHPLQLAAAGTLFAVNLIFVGPPGASFYVSLLAIVWLVMCLAPLRPAPWLRSLDTQLGDLAYSVFLCHWAVGAALIAVGATSGQGAMLFWLALPLTNAMAWLIHRGVERPIESLRRRIRSSAAAGS